MHAPGWIQGKYQNELRSSWVGDFEHRVVLLFCFIAADQMKWNVKGMVMKWHFDRDFVTCLIYYFCCWTELTLFVENTNFTMCGFVIGPRSDHSLPMSLTHSLRTLLKLDVTTLLKIEWIDPCWLRYLIQRCIDAFCEICKICNIWKICRIFRICKICSICKIRKAGPSYQFWYCKAYDVNMVDIDRDWLSKTCQAGESCILYLSLNSYKYFSLFCVYIYLCIFVFNKRSATRQKDCN